MRIPKTFSLGGFTYTVERVDSLDDEYAHIDPEIQTVRLLKARRSGPNAAFMGQAFCHELAHGCLLHMGRADLYEDEELVDGIGQMLYQYETTKRHT